MTQKEKLQKANIMAMKLKSIARNIKTDCLSYDSTWALEYAEELDKLGNDFLNLKQYVLEFNR